MLDTVELVSAVAALSLAKAHRIYRKLVLGLPIEYRIGYNTYSSSI